jgi:hypothetical protein
MNTIAGRGPSLSAVAHACSSWGAAITSLPSTLAQPCRYPLTQTGGCTGHNYDLAIELHFTLLKSIPEDQKESAHAYLTVSLSFGPSRGSAEEWKFLEAFGPKAASLVLKIEF